MICIYFYLRSMMIRNYSYFQYKSYIFLFVNILFNKNAFDGLYILNKAIISCFANVVSHVFFFILKKYCYNF